MAMRLIETAGESPLVGPSLAKARDDLRRFASSVYPVLFLGPTGSGKSRAAKALHRMSRREGSPFVVVDCAAISPELLESELFGHERGAFTGAFTSHQGLFGAAEDGTIFLDEIGDMPLALQAKLLRVLDDGRTRPVGGVRENEVRARMLAATHVDLPSAVQGGRFRQDLFYRLTSLVIRLPALAEREGDIPMIVRDLCRRIEPALVLAEGALEWLAAQDWPGDVRELRRFLERAAVLAEGQPIGAPQLALCQAGLGLTTKPAVIQPMDAAVREYREAYARKVLALCHGNTSAAARSLGMGRSTLRELVKEKAS